MPADTKDDIEFIAFDALLKPHGNSKGGGFELTLQISEDQFPVITELLNPQLKNQLLKVKITPTPA